MPRWIWVCLVLVVLAGAYWVWPLVAAAQLASAAQRGDTEAVVSRVNLPALRRSLSQQMALAYLKATGQTKKLGTIGLTVAGAAATSVADPYVEELLTPQNITALLGSGKIAQVTVAGKPVNIDRTLPGFSTVLNSNVVAMVTGSYFDGPVSFVIPAKFSSGPDPDYRIHLRLDGFNWRLSGIDLPPSLAEEMARSILKGQKPATP